jgi:hypothetical protein
MGESKKRFFFQEKQIRGNVMKYTGRVVTRKNTSNENEWINQRSSDETSYIAGLDGARTCTLCIRSYSIAPCLCVPCLGRLLRVSEGEGGRRVWWWVGAGGRGEGYRLQRWGLGYCKQRSNRHAAMSCPFLVRLLHPLDMSPQVSFSGHDNFLAMFSLQRSIKQVKTYQ